MTSAWLIATSVTIATGKMTSPHVHCYSDQRLQATGIPVMSHPHPLLLWSLERWASRWCHCSAIVATSHNVGLMNCLCSRVLHRAAAAGYLRVHYQAARYPVPCISVKDFNSSIWAWLMLVPGIFIFTLSIYVHFCCDEWQFYCLIWTWIFGASGTMSAGQKKIYQ
jgi:hypothetical protein